MSEQRCSSTKCFFGFFGLEEQNIDLNFVSEGSHTQWEFLM